MFCLSIQGMTVLFLHLRKIQDRVGFSSLTPNLQPCVNPIINFLYFYSLDGNTIQKRLKNHFSLLIEFTTVDSSSFNLSEFSLLSSNVYLIIKHGMQDIPNSATLLKPPFTLCSSYSQQVAVYSHPLVFAGDWFGNLLGIATPPDAQVPSSALHTWRCGSPRYRGLTLLYSVGHFKVI